MKEPNCTLEKESIIFDLKKSFEAEYNAKHVCELLLDSIKDLDDKKEIQGILNDEKRHIEIVNELIGVVDMYYSTNNE